MRYSLLAMAALGLAACAGGPTGPEAAERFDSFEAVQTNDFRRFEQVQVLAPEAGEEVQERIGARRSGIRGRQERPLGQRDVDAKLADLRRSIENQLENQVELTEEGGPGVLTMRVILTDLNANRPTQAELAAEPGLDFSSIATGDAAVRIELSEDGQLLAVIEDADNINNLNNFGPILPAGVWFTADRYFESLATKLADLLAG
jgi:hypothetical protein